MITIILLLSSIFVDVLGTNPYYYRVLRISEDDDTHKTKPPTVINLVNDDDNFKKPPCDEEYLIDFLAKLQIINPESIIYLSTVEDINHLCLKIHLLSTEIKKHLNKCQLSNDFRMYLQLTKGVENLYKKICINNEFREEFLQEWSCLKNVKGFETCRGPDDWQEYNDDKEICKFYQDITNCYYDKAYNECGQEAGKVMVRLTEKIMKSVLFCNCKISMPGTVPEQHDHNTHHISFENGGDRLKISWCVLLLLYTTVKN